MEKLKGINFFSSKGKTKTHKIFLFAFSMIGLILSCSALGIMGLYFSTGIYKWPLVDFYLEQPNLVMLNTLPYILIGLLFWFVSNRPWFGFLMSGIVCLTYSFTNYWKLVSRDDPFYAEDVTLIREAIQMSDEYVEVTWQMWLAIMLVIVGTIVIAIFVQGKVTQYSLRVLFSGGVIFISIFLYINVFTNSI